MRNAPFLNLVVAVVVAIALGWLLVGKQAILLPIVMAVISVQFMVAAVEALGRLPILRHLRGFALRMLVLVALVLTLPGMAAVVAATVREIIAVALARAANLIALLETLPARFGVEAQALWAGILSRTLARIDLQGIAITTLGGLASMGVTVFLAVIRAGFMLAARGRFSHKVPARCPIRQPRPRR